MNEILNNQNNVANNVTREAGEILKNPKNKPGIIGLIALAVCTVGGIAIKAISES